MSAFSATNCSVLRYTLIVPPLVLLGSNNLSVSSHYCTSALEILRFSPHQLHACAAPLQVMGVYAVATTYMKMGTARTTCNSSSKLLSSTRCHSSILGALLSGEVVRPVDAGTCAIGVLGVVGVSAAEGEGCLMGAAKRVLMVTAPAAAAGVVTSGKPAQHGVSL